VHDVSRETLLCVVYVNPNPNARRRTAELPTLYAARQPGITFTSNNSNLWLRKVVLRLLFPAPVFRLQAKPQLSQSAQSTPSG